MTLNNENKALIYKQPGETPLEALERYRAEKDISENIPMTYAGRLDPMAEGLLLILIGDECKNKEAYLGLDKEYEVEIAFGIETDTHDALGLASAEVTPMTEVSPLQLQKYAGKFSQPYPAYSSKTVNGKHLHELSRSNELPDEMPVKEVEIYSIEEIGRNEILAQDLLKRILSAIEKVKGDFRQEDIQKRWVEVLSDSKASKSYMIRTIRVHCSSGTYMRSLADKIGKDAGTGAFALTIKRTKIGI